jgi:hypothetical protein
LVGASDSPTQSEVQAVMDKLSGMVTELHR